MKAAAKTIRYKGPKTLDHIGRLSRLQADQIISEISYNADDPSYEMDDPHQFLLGRCLEKELLLQYEKGIVSLAERANRQLMWSHYGDQHHGLCIGYSVPSDVHDDLHRVKYGGKRLVDASKVLAMLDGDKDARRQVDEAVLLRKAAPLARSGGRSSGFDIMKPLNQIKQQIQTQTTIRPASDVGFLEGCAN